MRRYRLSRGETDALAAVDLVQVERFAQTLRAKHRWRLARRYPLAAADRERFDAAHLCFYRIHGPRTEAAFDTQAIAFGRFVDEMYGGDRSAAPGSAWYCEIARYERQRLTAVLCGNELPTPAPRPIGPADRPRLAAGASIRTYRFAIHEWAQHRTGEPAPVVGETTMLLVHRRRDAPRPSVIEINAATHALVDACDGRRDLAAIVARVEEVLGGSALGPAVSRNLSLLTAQGAIRG